MPITKNQEKKLYTAHVRASNQAIQTVAEHLQEVAAIAKTLAAKINVPEAGELIGLLHDFGKYSKAFQDYIHSGTGLIDPDSKGCLVVLLSAFTTNQGVLIEH